MGVQQFAIYENRRNRRKIIPEEDLHNFVNV